MRRSPGMCSDSLSHDSEARPDMATVHDNQSTAPGSGGEQPQVAAGPAAAQSTAPGPAAEAEAEAGAEAEAEAGADAGAGAAAAAAASSGPTGEDKREYIAAAQAYLLKHA